MATTNASDQILLDLLGCNEWFSVDLPGDENSLSAAALSSSKDSLEKENDTVYKTASVSLEDFDLFRRMKLLSKKPLIQERP